MSEFIVIDGPDGCGKTTIIGGLAKQFPGIIQTKEPGGTPIGVKIRAVIMDPLLSKKDPLAMLGIFLADRAIHMKELVIPALGEGVSVISDRGDSSTFAYQVNMCDDPRILDLFLSMRHILFEEVDPFYIFLDVDTDVAIERLTRREDQRTHFDAEKSGYHRQVRQGYRRFPEELTLPSNQYRFVDANRTPEEVLADVVKIVRPLLA